jgi:hypothetical protein
MADRQDVDRPTAVVDAVHDPVVTAVDTVQAFELKPEGASDPARVSARVSSSDSRSSRLSMTAAGRPCLVITTGPRNLASSEDDQDSGGDHGGAG